MTLKEYLSILDEFGLNLANFRYVNDYKKDPRKYYCATFSLHPEETKIVMSLSWYGDYLISQKEFKKICSNKKFCFTKEQDEYYEGQYELRKKQKEIEERMRLLEKDFE